MNLEAGQLFVFKDLVPTEAGKIVNRDVVFVAPYETGPHGLW